MRSQNRARLFERQIIVEPRSLVEVTLRTTSVQHHLSLLPVMCVYLTVVQQFYSGGRFVRLFRASCHLRTKGTVTHSIALLLYRYRLFLNIICRQGARSGRGPPQAQGRCGVVCAAFLTGGVHHVVGNHNGADAQESQRQSANTGQPNHQCVYDLRCLAVGPVTRTWTCPLLRIPRKGSIPPTGMLMRSREIGRH